MKNEIAQKETRNLVWYFVLAYGISWAIGIPLALERIGLIAPILPFWAHYFVAYGPLLSAILVTWFNGGQPGLKALWNRLTLWRVRPIWWAVAFSPLILGAVTIFVFALFTDQTISLSALGEVNFLPPLGIGALVLWFLTFGIGEETGWRGFALPRLQKRHSALSATLILATFWALWHLPQFFYLFDPTIAVGWAFGLFTGAILLTWLFNSANGSVLITAVWHACFNFITASDAGNGILAAVVSTIVMVWAVAVMFIYKPARLSPKEKQTI